MKNYKRKQRTTKADNETLLLEQIKNLTTLIKELKSTPLNVSGNREKKSEIEGNPKFPQKVDFGSKIQPQKWSNHPQNER